MTLRKISTRRQAHLGCVALLLAGILILQGCGGSTSSSLSGNLADTSSAVSTAAVSGPTPTTSATPAKPFTSAPLSLLTAREQAAGRAISAASLVPLGKVLRTRTKGARATAGSGPVATVAEILLDIASSVTDDSHLENIQDQLTDISNQVTQLQTDIKNLQTELALVAVNFDNLLNSLSVTPYLTRIQTAFSGTDTSALYYYANNLSLLHQGSTQAVPLATLQQQMNVIYVPSVEGGPNDAVTQITGIYTSICPPLPGTPSVLKTYLDTVLLNPSTNGSNNNVRQPANVMNSYMLLENFFSILLQYQFQGLIIYANTSNMTDPSGQTTTQYIDGTFQQQINAELKVFLSLVDYMAVNLVDYRSGPQYTSDMGYVSCGVAPDAVYGQMLGRSRFFCSVVQVALGQTPRPIQGTIVLPFNYTDGVNNPAPSASATPALQLAFAPAGMGSFSVSAQAQPNQTGSVQPPNVITSAYPYTQWNNQTATASMDNHWNVFDYNSYVMPASSVSGGTVVTITYPDSGPWKPWAHSSTALGTVTPLYYSPTGDTQKYPPTTQATSSNTLLFSFFSGRWSWGFQRMSSSPLGTWVIPSTIPGGGQNNPNLAALVSHGAARNLSGTVTPAASSPPTFVNALSMALTYAATTEEKVVMQYMMNMPVVVTQAPGASGSFVNAAVFYTASGSKSIPGTLYQGDNNMALYLYPQGAQSDGPVYLVNTNLPNSSTAQTFSGTLGMPSQFVPGRSYQFWALGYNGSTGTGATSLFADSFSWNAQVVYMNTLSLFP